ncbi:DUF2946 family protein [Sphingobium sp. SYK-6]|uniref:DUF2946 family protein n=1 Tax=Sphingobium sp. (strain NBRC 103272 / SYK-6) TaxID=627192 RepID=UPI0011D209A6|nr:DUF2946 family protein [Sphingobium sp. SYK-6]
MRRLLLAHRRGAALMLCVALAFKLLMPAGYMTAVEHKSLSVALCTGTGPASITIALPADADGNEDHRDTGAGDQPCAFSALAAPLLAEAEPFPTVEPDRHAARPVPPLPAWQLARESARLRPPLRGPPTRA